MWNGREATGGQGLKPGSSRFIAMDRKRRAADLVSDARLRRRLRADGGGRPSISFSCDRNEATRAE